MHAFSAGFQPFALLCPYSHLLRASSLCLFPSGLTWPRRRLCHSVPSSRLLLQQSMNPWALALLFFFGVKQTVSGVGAFQFPKHPSLTAASVLVLWFSSHGRVGILIGFDVQDFPWKFKAQMASAERSSNLFEAEWDSISPHPPALWGQFWRAGRVKYHFTESLPNVYFLRFCILSSSLNQKIILLSV